MFAADARMPAPTLTADQIVEKNIAARGGHEAWRAVQSLSMSGKMEVGGNTNTELPFVTEMKRPRKTRIELQFAGQTAVQVYDGANGWKVRPFLGRKGAEPFSADELKQAAMQPDLDGPLFDYAARGGHLELEGMDRVEGREAYKLKLSQSSGNTMQVWVDAETFLESKVCGAPRRMDGKFREVATYMRDYRSTQGLVLPYVYETTVDGVKQSHKIKIDSVVFNPKLADARFTKPE
jgi:outer membrane lipoprotein-sorting protein